MFLFVLLISPFLSIHVSYSLLFSVSMCLESVKFSTHSFLVMCHSNNGCFFGYYNKSFVEHPYLSHAVSVVFSISINRTTSHLPWFFQNCPVFTLTKEYILPSGPVFTYLVLMLFSIPYNLTQFPKMIVCNSYSSSTFYDRFSVFSYSMAKIIAFHHFSFWYPRCVILILNCLFYLSPDILSIANSFLPAFCD